MGYSNAWRSQAYKAPAVASPRDPNHNQPEAQAGPLNWAQPTGHAVPDAAVTEASDIYALDSAQGGHPFTPDDHDTGIGYGAGLSWAAASAQADAAHLRDDGSLDARLWNAPTERDGTYHVDRYQWAPNDAPGGGLYPAGMPDLPASPQMWQGLNRAQYPNRRPGHRITRWVDRSYARRDWGVEFRPVVIPNAYTAPDQPPVAGRNQYSSNVGAAQNANVRLVTFIPPQTRRTPAPWDEALRVDGTAASPYTAADAGFQSWGL
jgi:hypothetical protein